MQELCYNEKAEAFDFDYIDAEIGRFCESNNLPEKKKYAIMLVVEEIVTNIIKYGEADRGCRLVNVSVKDVDGHIVITVKDNTKTYDFLSNTPEPDTSLGAENRDIGGLGLFLVGRMVSSSTYRFIDGENHFEAVLK